eukprot:2796206-Rhodomonas_salina.1
MSRKRTGCWQCSQSTNLNSHEASWAASVALGEAKLQSGCWHLAGWKAHSERICVSRSASFPIHSHPSSVSPFDRLLHLTSSFRISASTTLSRVSESSSRELRSDGHVDSCPDVLVPSDAMLVPCTPWQLRRQIGLVTCTS